MLAKDEISVDEARRWLRKAPHKDILALGNWTDAPPCVQRPVQVALQYLCDKDTSWENCMSSLKNGRAFTRELDEFRHSNVTRTNLDRMMAFKLSASEVLQQEYHDGLYTAVALCLMMESVLAAGKSRVGISGEPPRCQVDFVSEQPKIIKFRELLPALERAREVQRTPLVVCNGKEDTVCTFFSYMCAVTIDAKQIICDVFVKKKISVDGMRDELRQKVASALRFGRPLHIRMSNTALDWNAYCGEGGLPQELFLASRWKDQDSWEKVLHAADFDGACFDMNSHFILVTTDFEVAGVQDYYPTKLPYFSSFAVMDIDPNSIN